MDIGDTCTRFTETTLLNELGRAHGHTCEESSACVVGTQCTSSRRNFTFGAILRRPRESIQVYLGLKHGGRTYPRNVRIRALVLATIITAALVAAATVIIGR